MMKQSNTLLSAAILITITAYGVDYPAWAKDTTVESRVTLAQDLPPDIHRLELRTKSVANPAAQRVYSPPDMPIPKLFFVSPQGHDANAGTREQPFATFQRAQQAVRAERHTTLGRGVTVTFLPGQYELQAPLTFTAADGGKMSIAPVVYRAGAGGDVEISAGRRIQGWQPDSQRPGAWKTRITDNTWRFEQLWVNNRRAIRARTPDWWEFHTLLGVTETPLPGQNKRYEHTFAVRPELLSPLATLDEAALRKVQVLVFHKWDTTREWLQSISPETGTFVTQGGKMKSWNPMRRDCLFFFENTGEGLDAPGEWFLDQDSWLYYRPRPGENMSQAEVVAPRLDRFMTIAGIADHPEAWVRHLRFEGFRFCHAEYRIPLQGLPPSQAMMNVDAAAIQVDAAQYISFRDCAVEHIGSTAFWFRHACRDCQVERTRLFDLGISGVRIGEQKIVPEAEITGAITIDNCIIHRGGRIGPSAVGAWIGHSPENAITHCDIADFFYTAVSVGWRWGYQASAAAKNRIEFNHLHHIGHRILSDMGGVYTLGPSVGTRICNNVIHDVYSTRYGGWGLYPDEGSTGILFENNLVYDVRDGCFHQHYGKENIVRNNILAFSEEGQVAVTRSEPHLSFTFENNIVIWDEGTLLGYGGWKRDAKVDLRKNLYWRVGGLPFDLGGQTWQQWQAAGKDEGSLIADPLFVDVDNRNFALRAGSPATQIGFKPFDIGKAGVYGSDDWKTLAGSLSFPEPYVVPAPEPLTLTDDFEQGEITPLLNSSTLNQEGRRDLITVVSDGTNNNHCLRVQDHPDLKAGYNPHFYWDPKYTEGPAHLSYRLRLEPGAKLYCEWRDNAAPYRVGPSLQFHDQAAFSQGKKLIDLPENGWIAIDMRTSVGHKDSRWTLNLTLPNGVHHTFKNLNCDPLWQAARWVGFSSSSTDQIAFYLDDVVMENH
ncbi:MAG: right-handed parallel beta-helix repeat-containing protein [Planctomycetes bacterium]|nr:right-handed parallel beta-helix repeat-containing protein [Planctomycetota bacterium]